MFVWLNDWWWGENGSEEWDDRVDGEVCGVSGWCGINRGGSVENREFTELFPATAATAAAFSMLSRLADVSPGL